MPEQVPHVWFNVAEWQQRPHGLQPWRVRRDLVATARNPHFEARVAAPAGVRAEVITDAKRVELALTPTEVGTEAPLLVDVLFEGRLLERHQLNQSPTATPTTKLHVDLPGRPGHLQVWLPHVSGVVLNEIALVDATACDPVPSRPKWVTYGSSITHCISADGPSQTWPALVARELGLELYGLGLAAQCHLDYAIEQTIAKTDADFISLCLGINIYGRGSFDERSLPGAMHGFIARLREAHPEVPLAVISPLTSPPAEEKPNHVGLTLAKIREIVQTVATGFAGVGYISGPDIIGPDEVGAYLREDQLHPHARGYEFMARRLAPRLSRVFNLA